MFSVVVIACKAYRQGWLVVELVGSGTLPFALGQYLSRHTTFRTWETFYQALDCRNIVTVGI
jgi:hypothetical protein